MSRRNYMSKIIVTIIIKVTLSHEPKDKSIMC